MTGILEYGTEYHTPIMVDEVVSHLAVEPGGVYIDGTVGGGGHTQAILDACGPDGRVIGIDRDAEALAEAGRRLEAYGDRVEFRRGNYGDAAKLVADLIPVDGLLVDAGVSSHQLDDATRGFSFRNAGPLDMRMGEGQTLEEYLEQVDEAELTRVLREYGELRSAKRIAATIIDSFDEGAITNTAELAKLVEVTVGWGGGSGRSTTINPATLVFQALRIAVNDELTTLEKLVQAVPDVVRPGGRAVFITFHSLEDRIVKHGFRDLATETMSPPGFPPKVEVPALVRVITRKPITASDAEVEQNPRSRSAKLRAVEVL